MSRIRKQYKFMCWWNFGGISPRTIQHIIFCCWKVSILSKASSLPIRVQVLRRSPREEHISHFVHEWRNRNWALQKHNAEGKPVPILLCCCRWSSFTPPLTLHPVHQVHLCRRKLLFMGIVYNLRFHRIDVGWFVGGGSIGEVPCNIFRSIFRACEHSRRWGRVWYYFPHIHCWLVAVVVAPVQILRRGPAKFKLQTMGKFYHS